VKAGWQQTTLGSIAQVGAGNSAPQGDALFADGVHPFFRTSDAGRVRFGDIIESTDYLNDEGIKGLRRFPDGTILFPKSGASTFLNHRVMMGVDGYVSSHLATIVGDEAKVDRRYLLYFLSTVSAQDLVQDHAYPSQNLPLISGIPVTLPPLPEQQRIVGILDEAFDGIATAKANAEKNLQNARALFESHLQSVFTQRGEGWVEIALGDVCQRLHQGLNTAGEKVKFYDSGYPIIQTRNIDDGVVELDSKIKFMCEGDWKLYKDKYRPEVGDVFFTNIGTIGKTAIVTIDRDYLIHWNIFKLRPHLEKITSEFLRYTLEQLTLSGHFEKMQKGGTVDFVTKKMISEALLYLPSIAEQKQIVAKLDSLREVTLRLESLYQRKLSALDDLKKSLLHQAFSGGL
jgi:type I restriction enzyme, S subunit